MLLVSSSSYSCLFPGVIVGESWAAWPGVETSGRSKKNGQRRKRLRVELEICEWSLLMKMRRATCLIFSLAQVVATLLMMCDSWWALSVRILKVVVYQPFPIKDTLNFIMLIASICYAYLLGFRKFMHLFLGYETCYNKYNSLTSKTVFFVFSVSITYLAGNFCRSL